MSKFKNYINETINEMVHNVTWPTWQDLQNNTILVVVASLLFALLIFVIDFLVGISPDPKATWGGLMGFIYNFFISK